MQIEEVFTKHNIPSHVAGGRVGEGRIRFDLQTQIAAAMERIRELKKDLMAVLGTRDLAIQARNNQLEIDVAQPDDVEVRLLDLLDILPEIPPVTAVLGLAEDERPLVIDLTSDEAAHVMVTGNERAGKTVLLRTLVMSLALRNRQSRVQLAVIDGAAAASEDGSYNVELQPLNYLPHMLAPIIEDVDDATDLLNFFVEELRYRQEQNLKSPAIILAIDALDQLLELDDGSIAGSAHQLIQEGAAVGLHLILTVQNPTVPRLDNLILASIPARIVGQLKDRNQARVATGITNSQAEYLLGTGDFLAIANNSINHFQAAFIGKYDLHASLNQLHRSGIPILVAQTTSTRPTLNTTDDNEEFLFANDEIDFFTDYDEEE